MESEDAEMTGREIALMWVKQHKAQIGLGALLTVASVAGLCLASKTGHMPKLADMRKAASKGAAAITEASEKVALPEVSLTGVQKTATGLGNDLLLSNQQVNKRLVSNGMVTREPWGYRLTELGELFGKETVKTTRAGHTFSNIEWDEAVVPYICSPDELAAIAAKKAQIAEILAQ